MVWTFLSFIVLIFPWNVHLQSLIFLKVKSLSHVRLFATPWTVAHQAPPSMGFSRQEYWSGLPFPFPGDLSNPGIEPGSPTLWADTSLSEPLRASNSSNSLSVSVKVVEIKSIAAFTLSWHKARIVTSHTCIRPGGRRTNRNLEIVTMVDGARFPSMFGETVCNLFKNLYIIYKYFTHTSKYLWLFQPNRNAFIQGES